MTYSKTILADLASGRWVCGSEWLARYMVTYSQRVSEINAEARAGLGTGQ